MGWIFLTQEDTAGGMGEKLTHPCEMNNLGTTRTTGARLNLKALCAMTLLIPLTFSHAFFIRNKKVGGLVELSIHSIVEYSIYAPLLFFEQFQGGGSALSDPE